MDGGQRDEWAREMGLRCRAGKMALRLSSLAAFPEDSSWFLPSALQLGTICHSGSGGSEPFFWTPRHQDVVQRHTCRQTRISIKK